MDNRFFKQPIPSFRSPTQLIREIVDKALRYGPEKAHTGPAKRGDWITMRKHLEILAAQDAQRAEPYKLLSEMIGKRFS